MEALKICCSGICYHPSGGSHCRKITQEEIDHCLNWLDKYGLRCQVKTLRDSSYYWKHIVENWCGKYVPNGAFIRACELRKMRMKFDYLNAFVGISVNQTEKLMKAQWTIHEDAVYTDLDAHDVRMKGVVPSDKDVEVCLEFLDKYAPLNELVSPRMSISMIVLVMKQCGIVVSKGAFIKACQIRKLLLRRYEDHTAVCIKVNLSERILRQIH